MPVVRNIRSSDKKIFWSKIFEVKRDRVLAICDKNLIGKKIKVREGFFVEIREVFYKGELISENDAKNLMKEATIGNFFGKKIVDLALREGFITKENIIEIGGIPHAQFVKLL